MRNNTFKNNSNSQQQSQKRTKIQQHSLVFVELCTIIFYSEKLIEKKETASRNLRPHYWRFWGHWIQNCTYFQIHLEFSDWIKVFLVQLNWFNSNMVQFESFTCTVLIASFNAFLKWTKVFPFSLSCGSNVTLSFHRFRHLKNAVCLAVFLLDLHKK